jgi:hypothetical protein
LLIQKIINKEILIFYYMLGKKPGVAPKVDPSKLEKIKSGEKTKTETGSKQNKNVVVNSRGDKIIAVEKEKKFEEAGVTRKKRNFVMYESKTGTEKETDLQKIKGQRLKAPRPRVEETIIMKRKKKEYLDNYQYHETKELRNKNPAVVVHERLSGPVGGTVEEVSYQKTTLRSGSNSRPGGRTTTTTTTRTDTRTNRRSAGDVRERPPRPEKPTQERSTRLQRPSGPSVTTKTETTRVGRRSGPTAGQAKTTTRTTVTTAQDGVSKTQTSTRTATTRTRK